MPTDGQLLLLKIKNDLPESCQDCLAVVVFVCFYTVGFLYGVVLERDGQPENQKGQGRTLALT